MCQFGKIEKKREESKREAQKHRIAHSRAGLSGSCFSHLPLQKAWEEPRFKWGGSVFVSCHTTSCSVIWRKFLNLFVCFSLTEAPWNRRAVGQGSALSLSSGVLVQMGPLSTPLLSNLELSTSARPFPRAFPCSNPLTSVYRFYLWKFNPATNISPRGRRWWHFTWLSYTHKMAQPCPPEGAIIEAVYADGTACTIGLLGNYIDSGCLDRKSW